MARIHLPPTDRTPAVIFDTDSGILEMKGCSIHENTDGFFMPLLDMMEVYIRKPAPATRVIFELSYFNSSSSKYILDLLKLLDEVHASGLGTVSVEWHHEHDDLDMAEAGQDYKALLDMPVTLVSDITR